MMPLAEEEIYKEQSITVFCRDGTRLAFSSILQAMSVMETLPIDPIDWIASCDAKLHLSLTAEDAREILEERHQVVCIQELTFVDGKELLVSEGNPQTVAEFQGIDTW